MQSSNIYALVAVIGVYAGAVTGLLIALLISKFCKKITYTPVRSSISFSGLVKINFYNLAKINLNYNDWCIHLTDKDKNECEIHFRKNRKCRKIMVKMGSTILECYNAYLNKDKVPFINDRLYKQKIYKNNAFTVINKTKVFITENTEII